MSEELRRLRWSVPKVDVSVNKWLDAQYSISESLRALIRESIQREGCVDVVNKPVEQLPRRGRPPGGSYFRDAQDEDQEEQEEQDFDPAPHQAVAARAPQQDAAAVSDAPAETTEQVPESSTTRRQVSIDEVMASTRH